MVLLVMPLARADFAMPVLSANRSLVNPLARPRRRRTIGRRLHGDRHRRTGAVGLAGVVAAIEQDEVRIHGRSEETPARL